MRILILNGPNLNLLGKREPEVYGRQSFEDYLTILRDNNPTVELIYHQTNHEGIIIDLLHEYGFEIEGIILNAGAYTHTSIAIADAIKAIESPVVEVHISNIQEREAFRKHSYLTEHCVHFINGKGLDGYQLGVDFFISN